MAGELERIAKLMESRGFRVESGVERVLGFAGLVELSYIAGYRRGLKLRVAALPGGGYRVTLLATSGGHTQPLAGELERLGGSVEFDEELGRLIAVFKRVDVEVIESVINSLP